MQNPVAKSYTELRAINNDENYPGGLEIVRVQLNNGSSFFGYINSLDARDGGSFEFQGGVPAEVSPDATLFQILVPRLKPNGTTPQHLRFGDKPEEVHYVVCSAWKKRAIEQLSKS